ncbi:hypothetical protein PoMZ_09681 [Pyricularia oryzae]|uniref:Uncharacterized protein n=1 Tax=Pyricularia oryzae TaxID=318829 RepID=A0A4P7MXV2_PYROR|nr:hypothetical protein PoMZ_09681 [Pyricularia oryzae]
MHRGLLPRGTRPLRRVPHHGTGLRSSLNLSAVSETPAHVRFGSTTKPPTASKPHQTTQQQQQPPRHTVLEKPEKFNPPSHGARLPKKGYAPPSRTYGGDLSAEQIRVQNTKDYPGMPPPQGSMAHRIIHNRRLHAFISIGVLTMLAIYTYVLNFKMTSPYVDMIPPWSDFFWHPFSSIYTVFDAVRLTTLHNSAIVAAKREKAIDDVLKRRRYRKAHGIDESEGVAGWFKADAVDPEEQQAPATASAASPDQQKAVEASSQENKDNEPRKKILALRASKTSSATPPFSSTFCTIAFMTANFVPPLGGFQTPSTASVSVFRPSVCFWGAKAGAAIVLATAVSTAVSSAAPEGVNLEGGSMTRMESRRRFRAPMLKGFTAPESTSISSREFAAVTAASVIEMAMATSATASSSLDGSNTMLSPTAVTRSVTGGRELAALSAVFWREYRNGETSQSSSKRGSSSPSDLRRGSLVASSARCVVRDSKGRG